MQWSGSPSSFPNTGSVPLPFAGQGSGILVFYLAMRSSFQIQGIKRAGNRFVVARKEMRVFLLAETICEVTLDDCF